MPPDPDPKRVEIAGLRVSAIAMPDALAAIERWIAKRERHFVCITGVHGVIESRSDPELRAIHDRAGLVTPDGMPLVWMARKLGHPGTRRVYGPDLMRTLTELSARRGYRQYYFGGGPGLAERLRDTLLERFPNLRVAGMHSPPFGAVSPEEDEAMVAAINAAQPDIVWVGLSTPKQEYWMDRHRGRIEAPVMIGVGAAGLIFRRLDVDAADLVAAILEVIHQMETDETTRSRDQCSFRSHHITSSRIRRYSVIEGSLPFQLSKQGYTTVGARYLLEVDASTSPVAAAARRPGRGSAARSARSGARAGAVRYPA